jgi:hypothetical protein
MKNIHVHICIYVCVYMYTYMYTYIYIYTIPLMSVAMLGVIAPKRSLFWVYIVLLKNSLLYLVEDR